MTNNSCFCGVGGAPCTVYDCRCSVYSLPGHINLTRNSLLTTCAWSTLLNLNISVHSTKVCKDAVYESSWKTNQATYDFACTKMAEAKLNQVEDHTAEKGSV